MQIYKVATFDSDRKWFNFPLQPFKEKIVKNDLYQRT